MNLTSPTLSMLSQSTLTPAELEWINTAELYVISRRNKHRAGTRFKRRGIDEQGRLSIRYIDEQGRLSIRYIDEQGRLSIRYIDEQGRLSIRYIDEQGRLSIRNYTESRAAPRALQLLWW